MREPRMWLRRPLPPPTFGEGWLLILVLGLVLDLVLWAVFRVLFLR